ncbi:nuclear transport factor 2 family protein [Roseivivax marinus]|uniref:nuclear transport factor 2 family protein n=1 Tax=Roseivivax marinus TaxID=1379903 RepID=UPI00273E4A10|nr:nuclear transport factor 2 family protein [Roseivivax marinus]
MDLKDIAQALVEGCNAGAEVDYLDRLYADDAVSVESAAMPGMDSRETRGLDGIRGKHAWWDSATADVVSRAEGPFLHGDDRFAVIFHAKGRMVADDSTFEMREVAVYYVSGGRIVREEFFQDVQ